VGISRDFPNFLSTPIISGVRKATNFKFGRYIHRGPSEQKPLKDLGENGAWAYPGTAQIFGVPPIISETDKATNFKFGSYIHRVHPNKSPLKVWEKKERGCIQGLLKFLEYPLLSQECVKLQTSNLAGIATGSIRTEAL